MKTPSLLLAIALLFWGWMVDALWIGLAVGLTLEMSRLVRARFEFSQNDLDRIWNLCVLLFAGSALVTLALNDGFTSIGEAVASSAPADRMEAFNKGALSAIRFLQYAPVTLLPIVLAQAFAAKERFAWSTFSLWLRRQRRNPNASQALERTGLNVSYPYLGIVLLSASLTNSVRQFFLPGLTLILIWALWPNRCRAFRWPAWAACFLCALGFGLAAQFGLLQMQRVLRQLDAALMASMGGKGYDPKGTRTRIGSVGGLKQSGQIILRLEADSQPPTLLREAAYDSFKAPLWISTHRHFERTLPDAVDSSWPLVPKTNAPKRAVISTYLSGGRGLLPLPMGSVRLTELPVFLLQTNGHGAVQVDEGPGFVRFQVQHGDGPSLDVPPTPDDSMMPPEERDAILKVAGQLNLEGSDPLVAVERIRRHFADHFQYATWRGTEHKAGSNSTALGQFLLAHRSGHCEYFATATTLLLRAAGIPSRYAVGYSVQEKKGPFHVVRNRHAHAWSLAWIGGRWQDIDTTPGNWLHEESSHAAFWEPIYDIFSRLWFEFSKWRWGSSDWKRHLIWMIIPLLGLVAVRLVYQKQWRRVRSPWAGKTTAIPGLDSELYRVEERLRALGLGRERGETLACWFERIRPHLAGDSFPWQHLIELHYRLRFDPQGITSAERTTLITGVEEWLRAPGLDISQARNSS